ncbi:peptidylprolyl isomerase [Amphibacillus sp. MSJ-3]|uniref:peptidylprolyl isomerase n=1 Tax=Amphibacillus sp. MSJ-3 TaxID=2841505 RepID=UPI001C0EA3E8|nr:peptidylprolyl isomerase [Amphibacillus sp. MSJ-3]MBU5594269.1 peptidylprolyl isomerase [Amphibacillus sp. MSJ-3]
MKKQATITFENGEKIVIELFENDAPGTVANFEKLANEKFYDGVTFHRVIPGFVAQGGDPTGTGAGGPGYTIKCETEGNPHKHIAGALSMAHAGKDTGGSQFFLVHEPQPHLDGVHTVFGQVIEGMDVVLRIKQGDVMKTVVVEEV